MSINAEDFSPHDQAFNAQPITIILTVSLLFIFSVGFFSLFFCRCFLKNLLQAWNLQRTPSGNLMRANNDPPINPGLDPKVIQSFPSFPYSSIKDYRPEKHGLECAICLGEFTDGDTLRFLTICCHIFHIECIDVWLESHKTCPVCRGELDPGQTPPEKSPILAVTNPSRNRSSESLQDAVSIVIQENHDNEEGQDQESSSFQKGTDQTKQNNERQKEVSDRIFSRSHSTGHSLVSVNPEEEDKYRLRLPEHVKLKVTRGHNHTESCVTFGELTRSKECKSSWLEEVTIG